MKSFIAALLVITCVVFLLMFILTGLLAIIKWGTDESPQTLGSATLALILLTITLTLLGVFIW